MIATACLMEEDPSQTPPPFLLNPVERALLRLLVNGSSLEESSESLGLSPSEAHFALNSLQGRCGVSNFTRLIVLAILNAWV